MLHNYLIQVNFKGVNLLCAHGWARQAQHLFSWRRISQSEIRNSAAAEKNWNRKARACKNSFPQPPSFLPARAIGFQNSQSGFSSKNVRTSFKKHRQISHFEKSMLEASAQSASAWYFSAILKAFLKSKTKVRSAMRKFLCESTESRRGGTEPIFFLSSASGRTKCWAYFSLIAQKLI